MHFLYNSTNHVRVIVSYVFVVLRIANKLRNEQNTQELLKANFNRQKCIERWTIIIVGILFIMIGLYKSYIIYF